MHVTNRAATFLTMIAGGLRQMKQVSQKGCECTICDVDTVIKEQQQGHKGGHRALQNNQAEARSRTWSLNVSRLK